MSFPDSGMLAFPFVIEEEGCVTQVHKGMTLRDWFAGQALAGLAVSEAQKISPAGVAMLAYQAADAMLAARKGGAA